MISSVVGCGSIKRDGNVLIGSGSGIESGGASSSCVCCSSISSSRSFHEIEGCKKKFYG
ncbi:MAG: hypothetical protein HZB76_06005 [Chlamydiae bacterium]|nr:hypothetical protein [Chlamydiota bacterium]